MGTGALQHRTTQRRKRAGIGHHAGLDALNDAVFITAHGELHVKAVALGMYQNGLLTAQLELDRLFRQIAQQRGVVLDRHILLTAEAAADQHILHMAVVVVHAQHTGALVEGGMGALVSGQQLHTAVFHGERHAALRLQESVLRPRRGEMLRQHIFCVFDSRLRIAAGDMLIGLHVILVAVEHQRRIRRSGFRGIMNGGQHFILHLDQLLRFLHRGLIHGADQRDAVAQIVGQLTHAHQSGLVLLDMAHVHLTGNILGCSHSHHTGQLLRLRGVNGQNAGAGILAAYRAAVAHAIHIYVIRILAIALYLFRHVQTMDTAAHLPVVSTGRRNLALTENLRCQQNSVNDLYITGAAADVVANGKRRFFTGGIRIHVQQPLGGDHHAGDTEAALYRAGLTKGEGIDLLFPIRQAFHRQDGLAIQLVGLRDTGLCGLAVNQNMAGTASAFAAAVLHRGQMQLIPQIADQLLVFLHCHGAAVHLKSRHTACSFPLPQGR